MFASAADFADGLHRTRFVGVPKVATINVEEGLAGSAIVVANGYPICIHRLT